ncbi:3-phenylpropionate/trans-cinnamate dioxygenase ferredoxin reductase subunit [Rhizobiales bacterium GAS188]|nr:3-phenylpropionate/trans-cinnamate dioxygenase ferredoxin reductase subunit [Rhizobiales bacterium GAS188]
MSRLRKVEVNGEAFSARSGDLLLDAALMSGVDIPHDCRSGYCGTCRVRVLEGRVFGGQTSDSGEVHACQCRIISDVKVAVEDVPGICTESGRVTSLNRLAPDVVEVCVEVSQPTDYLPGQHYKVKFRGLPARCYSPTIPLEGPEDDHLIRFHVRLVPGGRVSSALGNRVRVGHRVKLLGPLGSAYLRSHRTRRLVLVAGGTGFAPMWSIADAAMRERPERPLTLVVGARNLESLYMIPALCQLATFRNVTIVPVVFEPQSLTKVVREGLPTDHLPALSERDVVYTAGVPAMVESVAGIAEAANAKCYMDPFAPAPDGAEGAGLLSRGIDWFSARLEAPGAVQAG